MATDSKVKFLSIEEFKNQIDADSLTVLKNEKTGKLFMSASNGETYKVEQAINNKKEMKILVPEEGLVEACLVNVSSSAKEVFTV